MPKVYLPSRLLIHQTLLAMLGAGKGGGGCAPSLVLEGVDEGLLLLPKTPKKSQPRGLLRKSPTTTMMGEWNKPLGGFYTTVMNE